MSASQFSIVRHPDMASDSPRFEGYSLVPATNDVPQFTAPDATAATLNDHQGLLAMLYDAHLSQDALEAKLLSYWNTQVTALRDSPEVAVFTTGRLGRETAETLRTLGKKIVCFVDNNPDRVGQVVDGVKVCSAQDMAGNAVPIVIATTRFTQSILQQMQTLGAPHMVPYSLVSLIWKDLFSVEIPYVNNLADFIQTPQSYVDLFSSFEDSRSRLVLDQMIKYRLTHDPQFLVSINDGEDNQYHDTEINPMGPAEVFVDVGGFDGDTVQRFLRNAGYRHAHIYLFEPEPSLLERAKENLNGLTQITYVGAGAYSENTTLSFDATGTVNGAVTEDGQLQIPVRRIDDVLEHAPSFIKMDIEGAEVEALKGATHAIQTHKPKLAIAAYHFGSQMRDVVDAIQALRPDYRFYLRHYTETGLETVVYAV